jgi:ribosomal protein S18 acetylase RimI-like enzyme
MMHEPGRVVNAGSLCRLRSIGEVEWASFRALRREALREAPYAFGSTLEDWSAERDTEARWRERLVAVPLNLIAELDGRPAGMVSGTHPSGDGAVELISMWVAPFARGRGVAAALVEGVVDWALGRGARSVVLAVRRNNARAVAFYERQGFVAATGVAAPECRDEFEMERVLQGGLTEHSGTAK